MVDGKIRHVHALNDVLGWRRLLRRVAMRLAATQQCQRQHRRGEQKSPFVDLAVHFRKLRSAATSFLWSLPCAALNSRSTGTWPVLVILWVKTDPAIRAGLHCDRAWSAARSV